MEKTGLTYEIIEKNMVYYANDLEIFIELENGKVFGLLSDDGDLVEITRDDLEEVFSSRGVRLK
ncbi:hypothetical protein [Clostridium cochlearium]|uniref:Uncharacterized protein n=1 Tax=Clostridium cochlearium TaxID=1494 RepID=A0A7Y3V8B0_CLOCO|nr:hypothetical protein [Clostridium cochlearium]NOH15281.1 hypothetical protein [Clostridium cochlearium]